MRTKNRRKGHLLALLLALALASTACGASDSILSGIADPITGGVTDSIDDATAEATQAIDRATDRLANESDQMQVIFDDLAQELGDEAQTVIAEIEVVATRAVAAAGTQIICIADFARQRAHEDLRHIRNELLSAVTLSLYQPTLPPRSPFICSAPSPNLIRHGEVPDFVELSGYDLDEQDIRFLIKGDGETRDITSEVAISTQHYTRTIPFGQNAVRIERSDRSIVVATADKIIAEIPIIEPGLPPCGTKTIRGFTPSPMDVMPKNESGDNEFHGNGPEIEVKASLAISESKEVVTATISMRADETGGANKEDLTKSFDEESAVVYPGEQGWRITSLSSLTIDNETLNLFQDDGHASMQRNGDPSGPVRLWTIFGDVKGLDVGSETRLTVTFQPIDIELEQVDGCS